MQGLNRAGPKHVIASFPGDLIGLCFLTDGTFFIPINNWKYGQFSGWHPLKLAQKAPPLATVGALIE